MHGLGLKKKIINLLEKEVANPSTMTVEMSLSEDSDKVISLLENMLKGIKD